MHHASFSFPPCDLSLYRRHGAVRQSYYRCCHQYDLHQRQDQWHDWCGNESGAQQSTIHLLWLNQTSWHFVYGSCYKCDDVKHARAHSHTHAHAHTHTRTLPFAHQRTDGQRLYMQGVSLIATSTSVIRLKHLSRLARWSSWESSLVNQSIE